MKDGFLGQRILVMPQMVVQLMERDPLLSQLHITDIGYFPSASRHEVHRDEPINQYVFIYCVSGSGWCRLGDEYFPLHENQYIILPPGQPHSYGADAARPWTIYWMHFKGKLASCYAAFATTPRDVKPEIHSRITNRINLFEEIYNTIHRDISLENLSYTSSLLHHYLGSLRYIHQYRAAKDVQIVNEINAVEAAIHYMQENRERRLTLDALSRYTGYSVSHFSSLFKAKTGHAPLTYFNLIKMQEACYLLDNTDMKNVQICHKLGIDDPYYFSRLFSKIIGMSPRDYRLRDKG